jgi:hypothetical protein
VITVIFLSISSLSKNKNRRPLACVRAIIFGSLLDAMALSAAAMGQQSFYGSIVYRFARRHIDPKKLIREMRFRGVNMKFE